MVGEKNKREWCFGKESRMLKWGVTNCVEWMQLRVWSKDVLKSSLRSDTRAKARLEWYKYRASERGHGSSIHGLFFQALWARARRDGWLLKGNVGKTGLFVCFGFGLLWDLHSQTRDWTPGAVVKAWSLNHSTTRELLGKIFQNKRFYVNGFRK